MNRQEYQELHRRYRLFRRIKLERDDTYPIWKFETELNEQYGERFIDHLFSAYTLNTAYYPLTYRSIFVLDKTAVMKEIPHLARKQIKDIYRLP